MKAGTMTRKVMTIAALSAALLLATTGVAGAQGAPDNEYS